MVLMNKFKAVVYSLMKSLKASSPLELGYHYPEEKGEYVFYRCKECGYTSKSVGFLHGHMEKHTGFWSLADVEQFQEWTEKIVVTEYRVDDLENFEGERM